MEALSGCQRDSTESLSYLTGDNTILKKFVSHVQNFSCGDTLNQSDNSSNTPHLIGWKGGSKQTNMSN